MKKSTEQIVETRKIDEVLHFTTSNGLLGIMSTGSLLAHSELSSEQRLSHILQINCPDRSRDTEWHSYVNLSISRVNGSFFSIARNRWHATKDIYWCVLSFSAEILTHENVLFSTTNNAYDATLRSPGGEGLEKLFAQEIRLFPTKTTRRLNTIPSHHTTCNQAEALYPKSVPISYLKRVYVPTEEILHEAQAQIAVCAAEIADKIELVVAPEHFE